LKLTRDSEYVIIKDARKTQREDLTDAELLKWSTPSFANYLSKRAITKKLAKPAGFPTDTTTTTTIPEKNPVAAKKGVTTDLKRKVMAANKNKAPEKGIKITVGAGGMIPKVAAPDQKMVGELNANENAVMIAEAINTNNDEELAR